MMNKEKTNVDWKVFAYTTLWSILIGAGKLLIFNEIEAFPDFITYGLAGIFIIIGLLLAVCERRLGLDFFYAWGRNWNGGGIVNSSMLCGWGVGFMPLSLGVMFLISLVASGIITLIKNMVSINEKNINAKEHYPFT